MIFTIYFLKRFFNVDKDKHRLEIKKEYVAKLDCGLPKNDMTQWIISDNGVTC